VLVGLETHIEARLLRTEGRKIFIAWSAQRWPVRVGGGRSAVCSAAECLEPLLSGIEIRFVNNGAGSLQCGYFFRRVTASVSISKLCAPGQGSLAPHGPGLAENLMGIGRRR